jgi:hypothetical protein
MNNMTINEAMKHFDTSAWPGKPIQLKTLNFYQKIALQARQIVRSSQKELKRTNYSLQRDLKTLRGFCREVSEAIVELLSEKKIASEIVSIHKGNLNGYNHCAVYVPADEVIIDGTINQYESVVQYAYKVDKYPLR